VLKPVDDARMFEKIGQTLADTGEYDIHIFGYPSAKDHNYPGIRFHPSLPFRRLEFRRLKIPFTIFPKALAINPDAIIVTTHELLFMAVVLKLFRGTSILYDIQENYFRNLRYLPSFPAFARPLLAAWVRFKEILVAPFVNGFILSDTGYLDELTFVKGKAKVIENKVKASSIRPPIQNPSGKATRLLFSGTLAESTGIFIALDLAEKLHELDAGVRLTIIGYCALEDTLRRINQAINAKDFIRLTGGDRRVPHDEIMAEVARSDFGIIAYPPNPSTKNTVPTKLYEYLGSQLPIVLITHPAWMERCARYSAAVVFDPTSIKAGALLEQMKNTTFYTTLPGDEVLWESEGRKLIELVDGLRTPFRPEASL
jgi:hypothetical protein